MFVIVLGIITVPFKEQCDYLKLLITSMITIVRFLALVTTMVTMVDHGNHRSNDRGNDRSNHRGYYDRYYNVNA